MISIIEILGSLCGFFAFALTVKTIWDLIFGINTKREVKKRGTG